VLQPVIDFEHDSDFEFVFDIAVSPEVNLELDTTHTIDYYKIKVDDQMVEENIQQIRSQFGKNVDTNEVTRSAFIRADFAELDADGNVIEEGIRADNVLLSMEHITDEETRNNLVGKTIDESVIMNPVTATGNRQEVGHMLNISHETAETLESNFICTVKSVQVFENAEVNEELYKNLFGEDTEVTTYDQFVEKLRENISASLEKNSIQRFEVDARKALVNATALELPETFLKRWLKETNKELTEEKIEEEFDDFKEDLKWQLIKNSIINRNEIQVSEEETMEMAKSVALSQYQQYGIYQVADEHLETFATRILEKEEDRERIVRRIFEVKVYDLVREKVSIRENEVTTDEFKALYQ
jgi:trigger factor